MQEVYTDHEIKPAVVDQQYMTDWVFHYNPHTELWNAIPRDLYNEYWNEHELAGILRAKHLAVLIDLLHKAKGDVNMIKEIARDDLR